METSDFIIPASQQVILAAVKQLKAAFPRKSDDFFRILTERIIANGFCDREVARIVHTAIDTIHHNDPSIGEIIHEAKRERQEHIVE
jgi:hypothetical protein